MMQSPGNLLPVGAILSGPHWPDRVRVVRVGARGAAGVLDQAVALDDHSCLPTRRFKRDELDTLVIEIETDRPTLHGDPLDFRPAAEAMVMRFALYNEETRAFYAERWCYRGRVDDGIPVSAPGSVEEMARELIPTLGTDAFFELH